MRPVRHETLGHICFHLILLRFECVFAFCLLATGELNLTALFAVPVREQLVGAIRIDYLHSLILCKSNAG